MQKQNLKNSIISFLLIISTILMPFSILPQKAEAQFSSSSSFGVSGYVRGLAPAIAKLPQCQDVIKSGISDLFTGIGDMFSGGTGGVLDSGSSSLFLNSGNIDFESKMKPSILKDTTQNILDTAATEAKISVTNQQVYDSAANKKLTDLSATLNKVANSTESLNANSSCIQSIGRLIVKMLLQKLTVSTVMWINSGYNGSPSFLQDPGKFFKDIADTQILQFGVEINGINPYGKEWLRNQALAYKTKFAENARYSLNEMVASTTPSCLNKDTGENTNCGEAFSQDFSAGGWDAWTAMTQVPANNSLGFKLMADNEIQKRLADTSQSVAKDTRDAIQAANGFLGDMRCSSSPNITQQDKRDALVAGKNDPCTVSGGNWEYVTPGKMVADAATTAMGYQNNSLLNVQDLNDAIAAVSDAILNQFSTSIYEKGFANLDYQGIDGVLVFKDSNADFRSQTQKDYIPSQLSSSWLQANPEFNIRTDLTQALIDEQRTYSDKLALQNKELMSTTDGKNYNFGNCLSGWTGTYPNCIAPGDFTGPFASLLTRPSCPSGWTPNPEYPNCKGPDNPVISNAYGLMPTIYQLDYCIPGPHPGWENDSRETLASKLNSVPTAEEKPPNVAGEIANGAIGVGLAVVPGLLGVPFVGPVLSSVFGMLTGDSAAIQKDVDIRLYYTKILENMTGLYIQAPRERDASSIGSDPDERNMTSNEGIFFVLNTILDRYTNIMNKTYFSSPDMQPTISKEAEKEFYQLSGYNQIIKDNKNKMFEIKTTVGILGDIKDAVDNLNTEYKDSNGQFKLGKSEDDYENKLKVQTNAFGRLSASMVNGDDIAAADDLAKQIVLKKDYIYKNLLKGPYGCEGDIKKITEQHKNFPSAGSSGVSQATNDWSNYNINSVKRMTYPFPILYDYNALAKGALIPDPWTDCSVSVDKRPESCSNKMPDDNKYDTYGPGFLSFIKFAVTGGSVTGYSGAERLQIGDLVYNHDPGNGPITAPGARPYYDWPLGNSIDHQNDNRLFEKTIGVY